MRAFILVVYYTHGKTSPERSLIPGRPGKSFTREIRFSPRYVPPRTRRTAIVHTAITVVFRREKYDLEIRRRTLPSVRDSNFVFIILLLFLGQLFTESINGKQKAKKERKMKKIKEQNTTYHCGTADAVLIMTAILCAVFY